MEDLGLFKMVIVTVYHMIINSWISDMRDSSVNNRWKRGIGNTVTKVFVLHIKWCSVI